MIKMAKFFLLLFLLLFPARSEACFVQYSLTFTEAEALSDAIFFDKKLPEFVVVGRNKEVLTDLRLLGTPLHVIAKGNKQ